jgi:hypothetical protein
MRVTRIQLVVRHWTQAETLAMPPRRMPMSVERVDSRLRRALGNLTPPRAYGLGLALLSGLWVPGCFDGLIEDPGAQDSLQAGEPPRGNVPGTPATPGPLGPNVENPVDGPVTPGATTPVATGAPPSNVSPTVTTVPAPSVTSEVPLEDVESADAVNGYDAGADAGPIGLRRDFGFDTATDATNATHSGSGTESEFEADTDPSEVAE